METPMTHKIPQEQAHARAERPAVSTGTTHPSQGCADRKKAIVELTDADLQAVNGGGSKPGIGSGSNER
jgi:hypothetical protein